MPVNTAQGVDQTPGALPTFSAPIDDNPRSMRYQGNLGAGADETARVFANLSQSLGSWTDRAAEDQGVREGKIAGLDPNYRPDADPSLMGIARRNAAEATYVNTLEASARQQLTSAYDEYNALPPTQRQPAALAAKISKIHDDFLQNHVFPEVQGQFDGSFNNLSTALLHGAQTDLDQRSQDAARASFVTNQNSARDAAMRVASIPATSDAAIADLARQHDAAVDQAVGQGIYTATEGVSLKRQFLQDISSQRVKTLFDNTPDAQKPAFAARFAEQFGSAGERDLVVRTVLGEAGGEGPAGMSAVAHVIKNRVDAGTYGKSASEVVLSPSQFSMWNPGDPAGSTARAISPDSPQYQQAAKIVDDAFAGRSADVTKGADHYYNPSAASPDWGPKLAALNDVTIGNHRFVGKIAQPGGAMTLANNPESAEGQTKGLSPETVASVSSYMASSLRTQQAQARHVESLALNDLDASVKQMEGGFAVSDADWAAKKSQYGASPDPVVAQSFATTDAIRSMYAGFRGMTPAQIEGQIASFDAQIAKGATGPQVELRQAAQKYLDRKRDDLNTNPLGRAARDGVVPDVPPLDTSNPDAFAQSLQARVGTSRHVQAFYGLSQLPLMTPDEKSQFHSIAARGGEDMVRFAASAAHVLGPDVGDFLGQVGGSAPSFAQMGRVSLMNGDAQTLRDAAAAIAMDNGASKIPRPSSTYVGQEAQRAFGGAFFGMPDVGADARSLAANAIATQGLREGWDMKDLLGNRENVRQTLQKAAGATFVGSTQYGGVGDYSPGWFSGGRDQKVLLPPSLRADQFGAAIGAITPEDLKAIDAPVTPKQLKTASFVAIGPGLYNLAMGDPSSSSPQWAVGADGSKFVLDLNRLEPALRVRLPGAYKGS